MKRKTLIITYGTLALIVILVTIIQIYKSKKIESSVSAPTQTEDQYEGRVATIEGTTTDMLSPDYWIGEEGSIVLFSPEEITSFNKDNPPYVQYYVAEEDRTKKLYMYDLPESIPAKIIEILITEESKDAFSKNGPKYINGAEISDDYMPAIKNNMAIEAIPDSVTPKYAVAVERCVAKTVPSEDFAATEPEEQFFDDFISAEIMPVSGVVILHESADGEWYYILSGTYCGWVKKDTLAICKDKDEWLSMSLPDEFLVVTGSEIVMEDTAEETSTAGEILPMGTKIRLSKDPSDLIDGRSTYGCYCVDLPYRNQDGTMGVEQTLIPISKDVNVGYLTMTSDSVIEQAFKFLGKIYGSGGSLSSNDCSGFVRQVYACYGYDLPRNAKAIAERTDLGSIDCEKMTATKKRSLIAEMPGGLPLYMDGHIMLYLGTVNGEPYVISSCATCIEPGHDVTDIVDAYCVFVSSLELRRASGKTWLEDLKYILWKEY